MDRKLKYIGTFRSFNDFPSYKSVFEWEDVIVKKLNLSFLYWQKWQLRLFRLIELLSLDSIYLSLMPKKRHVSILYDMVAGKNKRCLFDSNTIPVIIDFWIPADELKTFYEFYKFCPLVLVTSKEVYEFLKSHNCPLNIDHWPLSLPDTVKIEAKEKKFEFCFIGRKDPFFVEMIERYSKEHSDFEYVLNNDNIQEREYITNKGKYIMKDTGRDSYFNIIRQTKICVYTTPGYDKAKWQSDEFNQVTPRVMEMLSGGCYVLGHYPINADTIFYHLSSMVPQIKSYEDFCCYMEKYRKAPARDISECKTYLTMHNTTSRIPLLMKILEKNGIGY